jgi:hypothetical protein
MSEDEDNDIESDKSDNELDLLEEKNKTFEKVIENKGKTNKIENKMKPKKKSKNVAKFDEYEIDSSDEEVCPQIVVLIE